MKITTPAKGMKVWDFADGRKIVSQTKRIIFPNGSEHGVRRTKSVMKYDPQGNPVRELSVSGVKGSGSKSILDDNYVKGTQTHVRLQTNDQDGRSIMSETIQKGKDYGTFFAEHIDNAQRSLQIFGNWNGQAEHAKMLKTFESFFKTKTT